MHSDRKRTLVHMYRHVRLLSITNYVFQEFSRLHYSDLVFFVLKVVIKFVCDSQSQIKFTHSLTCVCVCLCLISHLISRLPSITFSPHMMMFTHAKRNVV